jgi:hypothetical protein
MRKAALLGAAAAIALSVSAAKADVYVDGSVEKTVTTNITEWLTKFKTINLVVWVDADAKTAAKADTVVNQANTTYWVDPCPTCDPTVDTITGSINGNTGITSVNQSSGNLNNQGTAISFAFVDASHRYEHHGRSRHHHGSALAAAQVSAQQIMTGNYQESSFTSRAARISGSIKNNTGITTVNQSVGNINNQSNAISVALSRKDGVALSDVALGQVNSCNNSAELYDQKTASITGSVNGNTGITAVNQTAGNNANQMNVVSLSATGF